ncbi:MAG: PD-(D/E)XK nuclease family protein, partial [Oscillospiraceae bacterium]|nr:PD-(D/E)XK nuclease family protein [Oscillospiraceae bacterium]
LMESVFEKYGLPIYLNRKTDILQKPPVALICSALEIVTAGWEYENVFAYLRTGLTGIAAEDVDRLENYVITWSIRGAQWTRESAWDMPPGGYGVRSDSDEETLSFLDNCRRRVIRPLLRLQGALRAAETGGGHVRALYAFLEEIGFCRRLEERSEAFRQSGDVQLADEYAQLWSILRGAMEQYDAIMGSRLLPAREFTRLWRLLVSRYDIASIPVALDRVGLGDIARHRRRDIRCLIVTGAFDGALPRTSAPRGLLSESECRELREMGMELHSGGEEELYREIYDVYASLTLPSDRLIMTYPADAASDRPSYILTRIRVLTGVPLSDADVRACRMTAPIPRLELAVSGDRAAAGSFLSDPEAFARLTRLKSAAEGERRALTRETAKRLYGRRMRLSASRVERFAACPFAYFVQYGLKAKPRRRAGFDSPVYGTFMHYILENVTRETAEDGGYAHVDEERCRKLTRSYVRRYAEEELGGLADKSSRFIYLFRRLSAEAEDIVLDMLRELQNSDFAPLDFELSFASRGDMPPVTLTEGEEELSIEGLVDRVDGWVHNGRLYLKIVDYKTGKKSFSLSDIWYGMGMQMLIYLFALANGGESRYKMEIVPAGVLYVPAREAYLNQPRDIPDEKLAEARARELRRSGLLLSDDEVLEAMGRGEGKRLLPVKFSKDGAASGNALASLERMGVLARHIDATLRRIGREMHSGRIAADPYFKSQIDNACRWCEYHAACHFSEEGGDLRRYLPTIKTEEVWHKMEEE